jgi:hypothetical protein
MARKYRILNTEPHVFYAQRSAGWTSLWVWENLRPFSGYEESFTTEARARQRIETDMTDAERAKEIAAAHKALLRGYPKVIPYR